MNAVIIESKRCSKCKISKSCTEHNFARNKAKGDGWDNYCKPCRATATREQYHRERNPEYYEQSKDKRKDFLARVLEQYDREHLRAITLLTRDRYEAYRAALKEAITAARGKDGTAAKMLARHYKAVQDVSPWHIEIQYPQEWRAISKWLRQVDKLALYQWLRTHYEVEQHEEPMDA